MVTFTIWPFYPRDLLSRRLGGLQIWSGRCPWVHSLATKRTALNTVVYDFFYEITVTLKINARCRCMNLTTFIPYDFVSYVSGIEFLVNAFVMKVF
jgi:hypothetical protein